MLPGEQRRELLASVSAPWPASNASSFAKNRRRLVTPVSELVSAAARAFRSAKISRFAVVVAAIVAPAETAQITAAVHQEDVSAFVPQISTVDATTMLALLGMK